MISRIQTHQPMEHYEIVFAVAIFFATLALVYIVPDVVAYFRRMLKIQEHRKYVTYLLTLPNKTPEVIRDVNEKCIAIFNLAQQNNAVKDMKFAVLNSTDQGFIHQSKNVIDEIIKKRKVLYKESPVTRIYTDE